MEGSRDFFGSNVNEFDVEFNEGGFHNRPRKRSRSTLVQQTNIYPIKFIDNGE